MRKKLLLSFCAVVFASFTLIAQNITVTGKVTDALTGAPLSGVTISLNAKGLGVTKADGTYSVVVPPSAKKLTISYGMDKYHFLIYQHIYFQLDCYLNLINFVKNLVININLILMYLVYIQNSKKNI
jgi:hypothetical protein